jgi:hypothetical protein
MALGQIDCGLQIGNPLEPHPSFETASRAERQLLAKQGAVDAGIFYELSGPVSAA